jgi:uncharacterized membrane protein
MSKQEEIKQALAAATPGPWAIYKTAVGKCEETLIGTEYDHPQLKAPDNIVGHACGLGGEFVYIREDDANLIAKAPEYIAYLVETLEEVLLDRDIAKQNSKQWEKCYDAAEEKSDQLRKELKEARKTEEKMINRAGLLVWLGDLLREKDIEIARATHRLAREAATDEAKLIKTIIRNVEVQPYFVGQLGEGNHDAD